MIRLLMTTDYDARAIVKARKELGAAERAIVAMARAHSFGDYEHHWRSFLNAAVKVWTKLQNGAQRGTAPTWLRNLSHAMKSDELLV